MMNLNWNETEARAKKMTIGQLQFAHNDCLEAAKALGTGPQIGKDAGYYSDEASVYWKELQTRLHKPLTRRGLRAMKVLMDGGHFSYRLETDNHTHREQFQTRLIDRSGNIVKGIGFKTHQELLNLGKLRSMATYRSSVWEERTTAKDNDLVANEAEVHQYNKENRS